MKQQVLKQTVNSFTQLVTGYLDRLVFLSWIHGERDVWVENPMGLLY